MTSVSLGFINSHLNIVGLVSVIFVSPVSRLLPCVKIVFLVSVFSLPSLICLTCGSCSVVSSATFVGLCELLPNSSTFLHLKVFSFICFHFQLLDHVIFISCLFVITDFHSQNRNHNPKTLLSWGIKNVFHATRCDDFCKKNSSKTTILILGDLLII